MKRSPFGKVMVAVGGVLCALLLVILACNVTIIIKGTVNPDKPPTVFGVAPMVVLSGSMSGTAEDHIEVGDLIFCTKPDIDSLKEGDIVSFMDNRTVVTHRIVKIEQQDGQKLFTTKGDANNIEDSPISADKIIGKYKGRIPKLGDFAMFLQTPLGMAVFIGIPVCAFIIYDIIRRQHQAKKGNDETEELKKELERLKAEKAQNDREGQ